MALVEWASVASLAQAVETYIRSKDENRPHILGKVFAEDAKVEVVLDTTAISFPPLILGLDAIADESRAKVRSDL